MSFGHVTAGGWGYEVVCLNDDHSGCVSLSDNEEMKMELKLNRTRWCHVWGVAWYWKIPKIFIRITQYSLFKPTNAQRISIKLHYNCCNIFRCPRTIFRELIFCVRWSYKLLKHYSWSDVWLTVHRKFSVDKKYQLDVTFCILYFSSNSCSTCFG